MLLSNSYPILYAPVLLLPLFIPILCAFFFYLALEATGDATYQEILYCQKEARVGKIEGGGSNRRLTKELELLCHTR